MEPWHTDPDLFQRQARGLVREAMAIIRSRRATFTAKPKPSGTKDRDVVTDVDIAVQTFFEEQLLRLFPGVGIIGEEELFVPCTLAGRSVYWTVDPLDGTMVFSERAPHGFSVLLSLVEEGKVIAAFVGDVMTGTLYWYAPGTEPAYEEHDGRPTPITGHLTPADESSVLFSLEPDRLPLAFRELYGPLGPFDRFDLDRGSIGLRFMRMATGSVAANAMRGGREQTPWDDTPLIGFCRKLGFRYLALDNGKFAPIEPRPVQKPTPSPSPVLVVHESRLRDLRPWLH